MLMRRTGYTEPTQHQSGRTKDHEGSTLAGVTGAAVFGRHPPHFATGIYMQRLVLGYYGVLENAGMLEFK